MARRLAARPEAEPRRQTLCEETSAWSAARNRGSTPTYDRAEAAAGLALCAGLAAVPVGGGRARQRCPWAAAGPGRSAGERWRGLAGQRGDAPSEARGADGERAGSRPRAHRAARPTGQHVRRQEHQQCRKQHKIRHTATRPGTQKPTPAIGCRPVVELGGFEPPTFSLRTRRATNCAIAPRTDIP